MKVRKSISFKLAKVGVVLAFALGLVMSTVQVYIDFKNQSANLGDIITRILEVAKPTAKRAVHTLDENLSLEVVNGLLVYPFVVEVKIVDELGNALAVEKKERIESNTRWLTRYLGDEFRYYQLPLKIEGLDTAETGYLSIVVDRDKVLAPFFKRSMVVFVSGFLRNMFLVLLFFIAFYWLIAKPLKRLSNEIKEMDPAAPRLQPLTMDPAHTNDELGHVTEVANQYISAVSSLFQQKEDSQRLVEENQRHLSLIIDTVPHMIYARDTNGKYVFANRATAESYGITVDELLHNKTIVELHRHISTQELSTFLSSDKAIIEGVEEQVVADEVFTDIDGRSHTLHTYKVPLDYYGETIALGVSVDVTEQKKAEAQMKHQAYHDPLTNLPNRLRLIEVVEKELERSLRHDYVGAVLFIDLDHFKNINDSLGHPVGDMVLQEIALRLQRNCRKEDVVARLGGDEFVVVAPEIDKDIRDAATAAMDVAEKVREMIGMPIISGGQSLRVTASVGIVLFPESDKDVYEILRYADTAMYHAKGEGRDTIEFFSESMADVVNRHLQLENELRHAIEREEFILHYQPKVRCNDQWIVGSEVLLRWQHPTEGVVSPGEFIPILESSRLILPAGRWLLRQVFLDVKKWVDEGLWSPTHRVGINISPRQFRDKHFVDDIKMLLQETRVPPTAIELEITEGIVIHNVEDTIRTMKNLCDIGITFSLDDFGTGYSSLSYLKQLPVDSLKVDQAFVRDIHTDPNDAAIVEATLAMAKGLGIDVVAEGVETQEQLDFLMSRDCDMYQGYFFSRPVSKADFEELVRRHRSAA